MTHSEYLEQALSPPSTSVKCATREAIKKVFPTRNLVTLPRPHKGESAQKLDTKTPSAIQPKFDKFLAVFRNHVCENVQPFKVAGVEVGGTVYVEHVRNLVNAINRDEWCQMWRIRGHCSHVRSRGTIPLHSNARVRSRP